MGFPAYGAGIANLGWRYPWGGLTAIFGSAFNPASLFAANEQGVWYDPSDLTSMFQDSLGQTAAAVASPVGLLLDKRFNLARGPELITNGTFDTDITGWTARNDATIAWQAGGRIRVTDVGPTPWGAANQGFATVVGKTYRVEASVVADVSGNFYVIKADSATDFTIGRVDVMNFVDAPVSAILHFVATAATTYIWQLPGNLDGDWADFDNISVKLVDGNHATQATTAAKPTAQSGYITTDTIDDYMTAAASGGGTTGILLCAGIRAGAAGTARTIWSDTGTNTGYKLTINAANQLVLSAGTGAAFTSVIGPTITAGADYVVMGWHDGTNLNVRINLAAATQAAHVTTTAGTAGFTVGRDNGAATSYYGDRIYGVVYRKNDTSTSAQRDDLTRYMAGKSGVTL